MTEPLPDNPEPAKPEPAKPESAKKPKPKISFARIAIWVVVGGIGLYLVFSGLTGVIIKGM